MSKNGRTIFYAGVGSRNTPPVFIDKITKLAEALDKEKGFVLRSGNAGGADRSFQKGAENLEVFLPWPGFNSGHGGSVEVSKEIRNKSMYMVSKFHKNFKALTKGELLLHARNMQILLGRNLDDPVSFVLYWNPIGKKMGGTYLTISAAKKLGIPVFNLNSRTQYDNFIKFLETELEV